MRRNVSSAPLAALSAWCCHAMPLTRDPFPDPCVVLTCQGLIQSLGLVLLLQRAHPAVSTVQCAASALIALDLCPLPTPHPHPTPV